MSKQIEKWKLLQGRFNALWDKKIELEEAGYGEGDEYYNLICEELNECENELTELELKWGN